MTALTLPQQPARDVSMVPRGIWACRETAVTHRNLVARDFASGFIFVYLVAVSRHHHHLCVSCEAANILNPVADIGEGFLVAHRKYHDLSIWRPSVHTSKRTFRISLFPQLQFDMLAMHKNDSCFLKSICYNNKFVVGPFIRILVLFLEEEKGSSLLPKT